MNFKLATTVAASLALLAVATSGAHAVAPTNFATLPAGDVLLQSLATPFSVTVNSQTTSGTLYSAVFSTTTGARDFFYQFVNDGTSSAPITSLSVSDFAAFPGTYFQSTTVDIDGTGAFTTGGNTASNSSTASGTATFDFAGSTVAPGGKSATLMVRTSAPNYGFNNGAVIAGAAANAQILAPAAAVVVPESGTLALIGTGAFGLLGVVVRRGKTGK